MSSYCKEGIKRLSIKAVVKNVVIKPLEAVDLPEDKEIVIYIPEEKEEEEYSDWTEEEWQMMKHQEYLCPVTGDINKHYEREVIRIG
ncbi:MAG: DUF104 domain-containing protein [Methanophagales archaeon]|nr:DUF104 domain-containing protein [Methanophagales archaeon]